MKTSIEQLAQDVILFGVDSVSSETLIDILRAADQLYHSEAESFLTDEQYDHIKRYAETNRPNDPYFLGVGSQVRGGKVKLPYPMGSLTQAYEGDIVKWIEKHNLQEQPIIYTEKLDGVSVLLIYDNTGKLQIAYSRGDGVEGADITRHISKIAAVPQQVSIANLHVRAEVIISKENFLKVQPLVKNRGGQQYKNARNMIAGLMNAEKNDPVVYEYIDIVAYEVLNPQFDNKWTQIGTLSREKFIVPSAGDKHGKDIDDNVLTSILNNLRQDSAYEIDGIVLEVDNGKLRSKINPSTETLNPEYARKYKIADASNLAIATVIDILLNVSKDGYIKPTIVVEPVELVGVTVSKCTGFNMKYIYDNKIQPGSKIHITRSGDVIPLCLGVVDPGPLV